MGKEWPPPFKMPPWRPEVYDSRIGTDEEHLATGVLPRANHSPEISGTLAILRLLTDPRTEQERTWVRAIRQSLVSLIEDELIDVVTGVIEGLNHAGVNAQGTGERKSRGTSRAEQDPYSFDEP